MTDDDLEDEYELRLRAKKADLVEVVNVLHAGFHAKHHAGEFTPPDYRMVNSLLGDLVELVDVDAANEAMLERLGTGDVLVGEEVTAELVEVSEDG